MIQNIDSFPLEPVLMLKFATDFGFFSMLPTASQLATSLDWVPNDGDNENSRYPETTFKHIRLLLEVPTIATFTQKNLLRFYMVNKDPKNLKPM